MGGALPEASQTAGSGSSPVRFLPSQTVQGPKPLSSLGRVQSRPLGSLQSNSPSPPLDRHCLGHPWFQDLPCVPAENGREDEGRVRWPGGGGRGRTWATCSPALPRTLGTGAWCGLPMISAWGCGSIFILLLCQLCPSQGSQGSVCGCSWSGWKSWSMAGMWLG